MNFGVPRPLRFSFLQRVRVSANYCTYVNLMQSRIADLKQQQRNSQVLRLVTVSKIRCPACGVSLEPTLIPAAPDASFPCSRCRAQLQITSPDVTPIVAISVVLSFVLCVVWGLKGQAFVLVVLGLAAIFYLVGRLVQILFATPKLHRSQSNDTAVR